MVFAPTKSAKIQPLDWVQLLILQRLIPVGSTCIANILIRLTFGDAGTVNLCKDFLALTIYLHMAQSSLQEYIL